jgi:hypothetical protein
VTDLPPLRHGAASVLQHLRSSRRGLIETAEAGPRADLHLKVGRSPRQTWMEEQRLLWEGRHDRLEDYLKTLAGPQG